MGVIKLGNRCLPQKEQNFLNQLEGFNADTHFLTTDLKLVKKNFMGRVIRFFCPKKFNPANVTAALFKKVATVGYGRLSNNKGFISFKAKMASQKQHTVFGDGCGKSFKVLKSAGIATTTLGKLEKVGCGFIHFSQYDEKRSEFTAKEAFNAKLDLMLASTPHTSKTQNKVVGYLKKHADQVLEAGKYTDDQLEATAIKVFGQVLELTDVIATARARNNEGRINQVYYWMPRREHKNYDLFKASLCKPLQSYLAKNHEYHRPRSRSSSPKAKVSSTYSGGGWTGSSGGLSYSQRRGYDEGSSNSGESFSLSDLFGGSSSSTDRTDDYGDRRGWNL